MDNLNSIYEVNPDRLRNLGPNRAEDLLRKMLYAEARTLGIPIGSIHIPIDTNAPDGGVDARIDSDVEIKKEDLIKSGYTCYQMKSGKSFDPTKRSGVKGEFFGDEEAEKENLKRWIKDCMEQGGTYVLITLGKDIAPDRDQAEEKLDNLLSEAGYEDPKTEVWGPEKIRGFLQSYPTLSLNLSRMGNSAVMTFEQWSNYGNLQREIYLDEVREKKIENIRNILRKNDNAKHIHICGQSGIGKTRFALEALGETDLRPLVWYEDNPKRFIQKGNLNILSRSDNYSSVILVIDNCDEESRKTIWKKLQNQGAEIKVITISTQCMKTSDNSFCLDIPPLEDEKIEDILKSYGIPGNRLKRWKEICDGSPGVAHIVGNNWIDKEEDILAPSDTEGLWKRHISGEDDPNSDLVRERRLVLSYIALFKQFGYKGEVRQEAKTIQQLIEEKNPTIGWGKFQSIINYFKERDILRGERTLHISPRALHIKMWAEWWDNYGDIDFFFEIIGKVSDELLRWFFEMFRYANESKTASNIAKRLLSIGEHFESEELLETNIGPRLFEVLTEATPGSALSFLERTIGEKSREDLLDFTTGRREVIRALKKIIIWDEFFTRGARLLLQLGEAENEDGANNASGEFAKLFSPAPAPVAPTEKPVQDRLTVLKEALNSDSERKQKLGLKACKKALQTNHFVRSVGPEQQGLKMEPDLWIPEDRKEYIEYYCSVWNLLFERLDELEGNREEAIEVLVDHAGQIGKIPELSGEVTSTLQALAEIEDVSTIKVFSMAKRQLHFNEEDMPEEVKENWEELVEELSTDNYTFLLKKAVGNKDFRRPIKGSRERQREEIDEVAKRSIKEKEKLIEELPWLMSEEATNGHLLGRKLGEKDEDFSLLEEIKEKQLERDREKESLSFFSGYLSSIYEEDQEKWKRILEKLLANDETAYIASKVLQGVRLNDDIALKSLDLLEDDLMQPTELQRLGDLTKVSEKVFHKVIDYLLGDTSACSKPLGLLLMNLYYLRPEEAPELPLEPTFSLLKDNFFFEDSRECRLNSIMTEYYWNEVGKAFIEKYQEKNIEIAEALISGFGKEGSITQFGDTEPVKILNKIMDRKPTELWNLIIPKLEFPITVQAEMITSWLQGGRFKETENAPISNVPEDEIWAWVNRDTEERPWYFASFVPTDISGENWHDSLAREVLVKFGDREDVRNNLSANFNTGGWMGKESKYHTRKKNILEKYEDNSSNENVLRWINEEMENLDSKQRRAETREERFRNQQV